MAIQDHDGLLYFEMYEVDVGLLYHKTKSSHIRCEDVKVILFSVSRHEDDCHHTGVDLFR